MPFADNARIGSAFSRSRSVHGIYSPLQRIQQILADSALDKNIIRSNACLTGIDIFRPDNSACRNISIGSLVNNTGAFSSEFERHRRQMPGRCRQNKPTDLLASGKKDMIKTMCQKGCRHLCPSLYDPDGVAVEIILEPIGKQGCCCRSHFRRLDHQAVPGGNRGNRRCKAELQRIVPGCDIEHDTAGLTKVIAPPWSVAKRGVNLYGFHPASQMPECEGNLGEEIVYFGKPAFSLRFPEILMQRLKNILFTFLKKPLQLHKLLFSPGIAKRASLLKNGAKMHAEFSDFSLCLNCGTAITYCVVFQRSCFWLTYNDYRQITHI